MKKFLNTGQLTVINISKKVFLGLFILFILANIFTLAAEKIKNIDFDSFKSKEVIKTDNADTRDEVPFFSLGENAEVILRTVYNDGSEDITKNNIKPYKLLSKEETEETLKEALAENYKEPERAMYYLGILVSEAAEMRDIPIKLLNTEKDQIRMNGVKIDDTVKSIMLLNNSSSITELHSVIKNNQEYKNDILIYFELPNGFADDFLIAFGNANDTVYYKVSRKDEDL